jgi:peroxiredoxin
VNKRDDKENCAGKKHNPARLHMREFEEAKRLSARLVGQLFPDIELTTAQAGRVPLRAHARKVAVIYFAPGDRREPYEKGYPTADTTQHRGFVNLKATFTAMRIKVICVISQELIAVQRVAHYFKFSHLMFSDPELLLADALHLPTHTSNGTTHYRRLTLVCNNGQIQKVIYPIADRDAAANARQVLAWIRAAGW